MSYGGGYGSSRDGGYSNGYVNNSDKTHFERLQRSLAVAHAIVQGYD